MIFVADRLLRLRGMPLRRRAERQPLLLQGGPAQEQTTFYGRYAHVDKFLVNEFARHLPTGSNLRFLDVGVSPGTKGAVTTLEAVERFKRLGLRVAAHAIDKEVPESLAGREQSGVQYHQIDVEKDELPKEQFDVVRAANIMQYVSKKGEVSDKLTYFQTTRRRVIRGID
ncbi:MAG: class I SAM-dependent methyltransferase [Candidatus Micrarchaeota archaeon]